MLRLRAVDAGYGPARVVWGAELDVSPGEIVSLVGRNGVGKSTTLKAIVGLADIWAGEISMGGKSLRGLDTRRIAQAGVGYVAQEREICPDLTVEENLKLPLFASGTSLSGIRGIYDRFPRLRERARQRAGALSGGERKLLAFSRIILLKPSVYLIDEPSEGLMPMAVVEIGRLVRRLAEEGAAVLLVEQNLGLVRELSRRVYLMTSGRIEKCVQALDDDAASEYLGV